MYICSLINVCWADFCVSADYIHSVFDSAVAPIFYITLCSTTITTTPHPSLSVSLSHSNTHRLNTQNHTGLATWLLAAAGGEFGKPVFLQQTFWKVAKIFNNKYLLFCFSFSDTEQLNKNNYNGCNSHLWGLTGYHGNQSQPINPSFPWF